MAGALLAFYYFRFIDPEVGRIPRGAGFIAFSVAAFALLAGAGTVLARRWSRPFAAWVRPKGLPDSTVELVRRRALLLRYRSPIVTGRTSTSA